MVRALTPAQLFCNSSSYLQSSSQSSQSPLKKRAEVPISSFLLTAMRRGGGLSCVMSSGSMVLPKSSQIHHACLCLSSPRWSAPAILHYHVSRFPLPTRWEVHIKGLHRILCVKILCAAHRQSWALLPLAVFIFNASDLIHSCIH